MTQYECPNCDGGFPELPPDKECPWCGQSMDKSYGETPGFEPSIGTSNSVIQPLSRKERKELVNPDTDISNPTNGVRDLNSNPSTTPCPECGDPMPMVSWVGQKPKCDECQRADRNSLTGDTT